MLYWRLRQTPRQTLTNDIFHTAESLSRVPFKVCLLGETMTEEMVGCCTARSMFPESRNTPVTFLWVMFVSMAISDEGSGEAKYVDGKTMV